MCVYTSILYIELRTLNIKTYYFFYLNIGGPAVAMACWAIAKSLIPASSPGLSKNEVCILVFYLFYLK